MNNTPLFIHGAASSPLDFTACRYEIWQREASVSWTAKQEKGGDDGGVLFGSKRSGIKGSQKQEVGREISTGSSAGGDDPSPAEG